MDTDKFIQDCDAETAYFVFRAERYSSIITEIIEKEFLLVNNFIPLLSGNRTKAFDFLLKEGAKCNSELEALNDDFDEFFNAFDEQKDFRRDLAKQLITSAKNDNVDVPFIINRTQTQLTTYIPQLEDFILILSTIKHSEYCKKKILITVYKTKITLFNLIKNKVAELKNCYDYIIDG